MNYTDKITKDMSWHDIPTCKEAGLDIEYLMLRGIFTSPGVKQDAVNYYVDLFKKVEATPDWKDFTEEGRLQADLHDRRRVQEVGGRCGQAPP